METPRLLSEYLAARSQSADCKIVVAAVADRGCPNIINEAKRAKPRGASDRMILTADYADFADAWR
jgi:hypothetical protein